MFLFFVGALYWYYELEFYTYLCENEENAPACYVLNEQYEKRGLPNRGQRYLEISCNLKYERACNLIEERAKKINVK
jgi:hypothetical protein